MAYLYVVFFVAAELYKSNARGLKTDDKSFK